MSLDMLILYNNHFASKGKSEIESALRAVWPDTELAK
jgi:hypothetical protein